MPKFLCLVEKVDAWKELGVITQGRREAKVGTLLLRNDENNVIAKMHKVICSV